MVYLLNFLVMKKRAQELKHINEGYAFATGIIIKIRTLKSHHELFVKYVIGETEYEYGGGWNHNFKDLKKGDSIRFRYALDAPDLIVTELEDGYEVAK